MLTESQKQERMDAGELREGKPDHKPLMRSAPKGTIRAVEVGGRPGIQLQIIRYKAVDSYGSVWMPGCLNRSLAGRLPQLAWSHEWADVIGRAASWADSSDGPIVEFYLDDFEAVPRARQAYAQVQSGTIDACSIGFNWGYVWRVPNEDELRRWPGAKEIIEEAELDEVSLVLRGAVPGAKVLAVRSDQPKRSRLLGLRSLELIDKEEAARILTHFAAAVDRGEADLYSALEAVKNATVVQQNTDKDAEADKSEAPAVVEESTTEAGETEDPDKAEAPESPGGETAENQDDVASEKTDEDENPTVDEPAVAEEGDITANEPSDATDDKAEAEAEKPAPVVDDLSDLPEVDLVLAEREAV